MKRQWIVDVARWHGREDAYYDTLCSQPKSSTHCKTGLLHHSYVLAGLFRNAINANSHQHQESRLKSPMPLVSSRQIRRSPAKFVACRFRVRSCTHTKTFAHTVANMSTSLMVHDMRTTVSQMSVALRGCMNCRYQIWLSVVRCIHLATCEILDRNHFPRSLFPGCTGPFRPTTWGHSAFTASGVQKSTGP